MGYGIWANDMGDDSIDTVILRIDMGYLVTLIDGLQVGSICVLGCEAGRVDGGRLGRVGASSLYANASALPSRYSIHTMYSSKPSSRTNQYALRITLARSSTWLQHRDKTNHSLFTKLRCQAPLPPPARQPVRTALSLSADLALLGAQCATGGGAYQQPGANSDGFLYLAKPQEVDTAKGSEMVGAAPSLVTVQEGQPEQEPEQISEREVR